MAAGLPDVLSRAGRRTESSFPKFRRLAASPQTGRTPLEPPTTDRRFWERQAGQVRDSFHGSYRDCGRAETLQARTRCCRRAIRIDTDYNESLAF